MFFLLRYFTGTKKSTFHAELAENMQFFSITLQKKKKIPKKLHWEKNKIHTIVFKFWFYSSLQLNEIVFTGTEFLHSYNANLSKAVAAKKLPLAILCRQGCSGTHTVPYAVWPRRK